MMNFILNKCLRICSLPVLQFRKKKQLHYYQDVLPSSPKKSFYFFLFLRHLVRISNTLSVSMWLQWALFVCMLQARKAAILLLFGRRPFSWLIHIVATLTILGVVLLMAIFVPDIRNVFGLVGMGCFLKNAKRTEKIYKYNYYFTHVMTLLNCDFWMLFVFSNRH